MFATLASLNSHLISSAHRRLSVICPWCVGKEKTYTRVHDLEVHVRAAHQEVDASKEKFTRANGFYYALFPEDYARIVDKIEPYKSDVAFYARSAIRKWTEGFKDVQVRTNNWNAGWKAGVEISEKKARGSTDRDSRKVVRSRSGSRGREDANKDGHSESFSADASNTRDRAGSSDSRKDGISERSDKVNERGDGHSKGLKDLRAGSSDSRKDGISERRDKVNERGDGHSKGSKDLGAGKSTKKTVDESRQSNSMVGQRFGKGTSSSSDGDVERNEHVGKDSGGGTGEKVRSDKTVKDRDEPSEARRSVGVDKVSREHDEDKTDQVSEHRKRDRSVEEESRTAKARKYGVDGDDDVESESFENYKDNIELGEDAAAGHKSTMKEHSPSPSTSTSSSSSSDTSVVCNDGLQGRAQAILKKGCMPVCMPARRDWSRIMEFSLESFGAEFHWPPENWREMSPDQRLMAHEFISQFLEMTLQTRDVGKRYPLISRRALLDKYNFMALEGEAKPRDEASAGDRTDGKIRYYNYSYLKAIARGEVSDTRMSSSMVSSMEGASRWKDTDAIISKLDQEGVKIMM